LCILLNSIEVLLQGVILTSSWIAGDPSQEVRAPDKPLPSVVAEASPLDSQLIEVRVTMKNTTRSDLYVPTITIPSDKGPRARMLGILQHKENEEWVNVGHVYDIPADTAMRLRPGESRVFIEMIGNPPIPVPSKDSRVLANKLRLASIQGKFKVRLGYFRGHEQWQTYLNYVAKYSGPQPHPEFVESAQFEVEGSPPKP